MLYLRNVALPRMLRVSIVCVGTDNSRGQSPLRFATKDAHDMASFLSGPASLGTPAIWMANPTRAQLRAELQRQVELGPNVFIFFNSGHGAKDGIALGDCSLSYVELKKWIAKIDATHSLVILDVCHAGAYLEKSALAGTIVGGVAPDLLAMLASATPGNRVMCSTGSNRLASEGGGVTNGHFTAALLEAGARLASQSGWIDDENLFLAAAELTSGRWGQDPVGYNLTGDLPLARSHAGEVGTAMFLEAQLVSHGVMVNALVFGRRGAPTALCGELLNRAGRRLALLEHRFVPEVPVESQGHLFVVPTGLVVRDEVTRRALTARGAAGLTWRFSVRDLRRYVMCSHEISFSWSPSFAR